MAVAQCGLGLGRRWKDGTKTKFRAVEAAYAGCDKPPRAASAAWLLPYGSPRLLPSNLLLP